MNKIKLLFAPLLLLILILCFASCGTTKDIYIGFQYPNFVKEDPVEIKVGEKFRFKQDDDNGYMILIANANEFLDIDSVNLLVGVYGLNNRSFTSKPFLVENKGTGEYFFRVLWMEKEIWSPKPARIIIKSE